MDPRRARAPRTPGPRGPDISLTSSPVTRLRIDQCRVFHRGREFHFVTYEGDTDPENAGGAAMWYLMSGLKRCEAIRQVPDQDEPTLEARLRRWLDTNAFP